MAYLQSSSITAFKLNKAILSINICKKSVQAYVYTSFSLPKHVYTLFKMPVVGKLYNLNM